MLGGRFVRPLNKLFGVEFFSYFHGLTDELEGHGATSDMKKHLPWFTGKIRTVLLMNLVLLLARIY